MPILEVQGQSEMHNYSIICLFFLPEVNNLCSLVVNDKMPLTSPKVQNTKHLFC